MLPWSESELNLGHCHWLVSWHKQQPSLQRTLLDKRRWWRVDDCSDKVMSVEGKRLEVAASSNTDFGKWQHGNQLWLKWVRGQNQGIRTVCCGNLWIPSWTTCSWQNLAPTCLFELQVRWDLGLEMIRKLGSTHMRALLWQSQIKNKTRILHVPDVLQEK